jgi:hypothetical protein
MAVWHLCAEPFAMSAPAMAVGRVGERLKSVDEHQALRNEVELALEPGPAPLYDVRSVLLARVDLPFLRMTRWRAKDRHKVAMPVLALGPAGIARSSSATGGPSAEIVSSSLEGCRNISHGSLIDEPYGRILIATPGSRP